MKLPISWKMSARGFNLRSMTMAKRLALGFGLVVLLFAGTAVFAVFQMKALDADMKRAIRAATELTGYAVKMRACIQSTYSNMLLVAMVTTKDDLEFQAQELKVAIGDYSQAKQSLFATLKAEGVVLSTDVLAALEDGEDAGRRNAETLVRNRQQSAAQTESPDGTLELNTQIQTQAAYSVTAQFHFWTKNVDAVADVAAKATLAAAKKAENAAALAQVVLLVASGLATLVSLGAAWLIARSVTRPIGQAVQVAEQVARGDLSQAIHSDSTDEAGALLDALSRMQEGLHDLVGEVRETAHSIELASSEVAMGNSDLSQRTEQTAGNLQRASSSMEQLTGSVRQSADSAHAANALVNTAAVAAERGGNVVAQVVDNMQSIAAQSKKIADIIGVIDGIAFQTNILALNAAVEAARAGEQGRGFAVVAGEVRNLAQRSAAAAKDIKTLIGASVDQVESGSKLVQDAGRSMQDIVVSVRKVTDMIGEISASAAVQSEGIGEVGAAMVQLDQMTQQNAALVEQSAAAAESLKSQAQRLTQVVATFTLRHGYGDHAYGDTHSHEAEYDQNAEASSDDSAEAQRGHQYA